MEAPARYAKPYGDIMSGPSESALASFAAFAALIAFIIGATVGVPLLVHLAQAVMR